MAYKIWTNSPSDVPTVYLHTFADDGTAIWQACQDICPPFRLVAIYDLPFDDCLTPWVADGVRKHQSPFGGKAQNHLDYIINTLMDIVDTELGTNSKYNVIAGYSLAGLFALWAATRTDVFQRVACVSASFWYPQWTTYLQQTHLEPSLTCAYFSLGDQEYKTRHPLMSQINDCTEKTVAWTAAQGIPLQFDWNPGNHFTDPAGRMARGIKWLLEH